MTERSPEQNTPVKRSSVATAEHDVDSASVSAAKAGVQSTRSGSVLSTKKDKYLVGKRLGTGSFGAVFKGVRLSDGMKVAVKVEPHGTQPSQLREEHKVYKALPSPPPEGIARHLDYCESSRHPFLVMELLGPSLQSLFQKCHKSFTLQTAAAVGVGMLRRVKELHECGLIHQDIKPENFLTRQSTGQPLDIVMIDLAMAKRYDNFETAAHIPVSESQQPMGTARYMSRRMHEGQAQSRRDDLESLWYVVTYFVLGRLPWQGRKLPELPEKDKRISAEKHKRISAEKRDALLSGLCADYPELAAGFHYINGLEFEETPDYGMLLETLSKLGGDTGKGLAQCSYDWEPLPQRATSDIPIVPAPASDRASATEAQKDKKPLPNDRTSILHRILKEGRDLESHFASLESRRRNTTDYFTYYNTELLQPFEKFTEITGHAANRLRRMQQKQKMQKMQRMSWSEQGEVATDGVQDALNSVSGFSGAVERALIFGKQAEKATEEVKASWDIARGVIEDELKSPPHEVNTGQRLDVSQSVGGLKRQNTLAVPSRPAKRRSGDDLREEATRGR